MDYVEFYLSRIGASAAQHIRRTISSFGRTSPAPAPAEDAALCHTDSISFGASVR
jgi:hypothetical protein